MAVHLDISSTADDLSPAERAILRALPPMVEQAFAKITAVLFTSGILKLDNSDGKSGMDVEAVIAALYSSMVGIVSARGTIDVERAQSKVNSTLRLLMDSATFTVTAEKNAPEKCDDPDCEACTSEVAPTSATKH